MSQFDALSDIAREAARTLWLGAAVVALTACGGGGSGGGSPKASAVLNSPEQLAKAAAAVLSAYHLNNEIHFQAADELYINPIGTVACAGGGNFVLSGKSAADSEDGVIQYNACKSTADRVRAGKLILTCLTATDCGVMNGTAYALSREYVQAGGLKASLDETYKYDGNTPVPPVLERESYRGQINLTRSALVSHMDMMDGMTVDFNATGRKSIYGGMFVEQGNVHNCVDGAFAYSTLDGLNAPALVGGSYKTTAGKLEFAVEGTAVGTAVFNADSSITVKVQGSASSVNIPYSQYAEYCNLKQTYELLNTP